MALKIRLARGGAKKTPFYRIVVADQRAPRDGRFIERLGYYNPLLEPGKENRISLKADRIQHWLNVGAQPTDRVRRLLGAAEILPPYRYRETPKRSAPGEKTKERNEAARKKEGGDEAAPA